MLYFPTPNSVFKKTAFWNAVVTYVQLFEDISKYIYHDVNWSQFILLKILYRYFIALREIYQNVCPEVPGNPRDVIFPDAEGGGKYNISGIPDNRGTNILPRSNEITVMLERLKIDPKF